MGDRPSVARWRIAAWVALAVAGALVVLLGWFRIGNLDLGYHIAYGRHFLSTGEIVGSRPDPFLYAPTRHPFVNANWGAQVILALVERAGGAAGLFALRLGLIAVIFAAIGHIVYRQTFRPLAVALAWLLAALAGYERFSLRPELFSYAILTVQLVVLVGGLNKWWRVAALVGLQLLLVNLHSYFLLGVALTLCWAVEAAGRWVYQKWSASLYDTNRPTYLKFALVALGLQCAACCCHPWGVRAAVFPFRTVEYLAQTNAMGGAGAESGAGSWSEISEFRSPFSFWNEPINRYTIDAFAAVLVVAAIGVAIELALLARGFLWPGGNGQRGRWAYIFAIAGFFVVATQMRRNIAPFAFIASPLAVVAIARLFAGRDSAAGSRPTMRRIGLVAAIATIGATGWLLYLVGSGRLYYAERRITRQRGTGYSDVTFPRDAVAWLAGQSQLQPRLYVDYFASSNALLWLPDKFKLYVDTNTFAYPDTTLDEVFRIGLGQAPYGPLFKEQNVNVVMLHCGPDTQLLVRSLVRDDLDWALVYFDRADVIFVRRSVWSHAKVVMANPIAPSKLDTDAWIASATGTKWERALQLGTMANVPISLRWWQKGAALCESAVELAPDYDQAWLQLGTCYANEGITAGNRGDVTTAIERWKKAASCFRRVLDLEPHDKSAAAFLQSIDQQLQKARMMERAIRR